MAKVEVKVKTVTEGSSGVKKYGEELQKFDKIVGATAAGVTASALIIKQAFAWGEMGAGIEQTKQSFDYLNETVIKTPDLLRDMSDAVNGTISDFDLMRGLMTLTAGMSNEVTVALGQNAPALLEVAKAAQKLNPSLGSTAFLYESLATGIKRTSPRLLDNLGIIGAADIGYQKYGESIGKAADELTDVEKQIGLMVGVLEVGNSMIEQAGGNVDSLTDKYEIAKVGFQDFGNAFKKSVDQIVFSSDALEGVGKWFGEFGELLDESLAKRDTYQNELKSNLAELEAQGVSLTDRYNIMAAAVGNFNVMWRDGWVDNAEIMGRYQYAADLMAQGFKGTAEELMALTSEWAKYQITIDRDVSNLILKYKTLYPELGETTTATEDLTEAQKDNSFYMSDQTEKWRVAGQVAAKYNRNIRALAEAEIDEAAAKELQIANELKWTAEAERNHELAVARVANFQTSIQQQQAWEPSLITPNADGTFTANVKVMNDMLYAQAVAAGASAEKLALLGVATGQFTKEQAAAALVAAAMAEKIRLLGEDIAHGTLTVEEAMDILADYREELTKLKDGSPYVAVITIDNSEAMAKIREVQDAIAAYGYSSYGAALQQQYDQISQGSNNTADDVEFRGAGGPVYKGMPYVVGDAGRSEIFIPSTNGTIIPNFGGGSTSKPMSLEISQYFYGPASPESVRTATKSAGDTFLSEFRRKGGVA